MATNVPAQTSYDEYGFSTALGITAAPGTTYLASTFASGSYGGTATTTYTLAGDGTTAISAYTSHSDFSSLTGYHDFEIGSQRAGDRNDSINPSEDDYSWKYDTLARDASSGTQDTDFTYPDGLKDFPNGSTETDTRSVGEAVSNSTLIHQYWR